MACQPADLARNGALLIPASRRDGGARPIPEGDNARVWTNPNIFLTGGIDGATARIGAAHGVHVNVMNTNAVPLSNIAVETWISDFCLGGGPATSLATSNPGGRPMTAFFSGPLNPGETRTLTMNESWTPLESDALSNGGSVMFSVNCYANRPDNGQPLAANGLNPFCDQHHGQRRLLILERTRYFIDQFLLPVVNLDPDPSDAETTHLEIQFIADDEAASGLPEALASRPDVIVAALAPGTPAQTGGSRFYQLPQLRAAASLTDLPSAVADIGDGSATGFFLQARNGFMALRTRSLAPDFVSLSTPEASGPRNGFSSKLTLKLARGASTAVNVNFDFVRGHNSGDILVFDILQRRSDGQIISGARIAVIQSD